MAETKPEKKLTTPRVNPMVKYYRETRGELRKVTWPTREESLRLTSIVIGVTAVMTFILWLFDFIFSNGLDLLIQAVLGV